MIASLVARAASERDGQQLRLHGAVELECRGRQLGHCMTRGAAVQQQLARLCGV